MAAFGVLAGPKPARGGHRRHRRGSWTDTGIRTPPDGVGSYIAWAVGRYGGQRALRRWGRRLWLHDHDLDRADRWFARYGPRAVLIGRVLPVVRTFISLPAGIAGLGPMRFGI